MRAGDTNGDGLADLVWSAAPRFFPQEPNFIFTALATTGGEFEMLEPPQPVAGNWIGFTPFLGQFNSDGKADLAWVSVCQNNDCTLAQNLVRVGLSAGDGQYTMLAEQQLSAANSWSLYRTRAADVNGDQLTDLIFNTVGNGLIDGVNRVQVAINQGDGLFTLMPSQLIGQMGWNNYNMTTGDVDGDGRSDLVWTNLCLLRELAMDHSCWLVPQKNIAVGLSKGDGSFDVFAPQVLDDPLPGSDYRGITGDVNGDGRLDLVFSNNGSPPANRVIVIWGTAEGDFNLGEGKTYEFGGFHSTAFLLDVDGDGRDEIVFNSLCQEFDQGSCTISHNYVWVTRYVAASDELEPEPRLELGGDLFNQRVFADHWPADYNGDGAEDLLWSTSGYAGAQNNNLVLLALAVPPIQENVFVPLIGRGS
jgi:hypothetical protein